jgi:hypothetical protein
VKNWVILVKVVDKYGFYSESAKFEVDKNWSWEYHAVVFEYMFNEVKKRNNV